MIYEDKPYREFDEGRIRVYGYSYDEQAVQQIRTVSQHGWVQQTALMADNHLGYSMPIGGVAAYREMISPSGIGYDLGCGIKAVSTPLKLSDIEKDLSRIADEMFSKISFGLGSSNPNPGEHQLFESPTWNEVPVLTEKFETRKGPTSLRERAFKQLGSVGSGNHFCLLLTDPTDGTVWIATHFGSRGFGHGIATAYLNWAAGLPYHSGQAKGESMHALPTLLPLTEAAAKELKAPDPAYAASIGQDYKKAMELAGEYAFAGRDYVVNQILDILGTTPIEVVHNNHNLGWEEEHGGETVMVTRKGATPAAPGQTGFVGGSMADWAVIVRGVEGDLAEKTLRSTMHGAGRVMSRTAAKGVVRKGVVKRAGKVTREQMYNYLRQYRTEHGIPLELRGADVDESPFVYRKLDDVVRAHEETGTIEVVHRLLPVAVCMAGPDVIDPFKD